MKTNTDKLYQDLDAVLEFLFKNQTGFAWDHRSIHGELKLGNEDPTHIYLLCDKLRKDDFVNVNLAYQTYSENKQGKIINFKVQDPEAQGFYINYHGSEFFLNGGYKAKHRTELKRNIWIVTKIIAGLLNAVLIIAIGIYSLCMTNEKKELERKIELLEKRVQELSTK